MDHEFVLIAGAALVIMIAASVFSRRTGIATPLLLVALGIGATYLPPTPVIHVEPELVLAGVLPLLLYSSAVQLPVLDLRRNLSLIGWLSVVMVIVSRWSSVPSCTPSSGSSRSRSPPRWAPW